MKKLSFTLFLLVSCQGANHQAVNPGNESKSADSAFIDETPVAADFSPSSSQADPKAAPALENVVVPKSEAPAVSLETGSSMQEPPPAEEPAEAVATVPRTLSSVRLCDNEGYSGSEPFRFKVRVATYSDGATVTEIKLRKDIYPLIDTKIESAAEDGNFFVPMSDEAKMFFGYGQVQPVYANPLFRIEMFQNEKNLPLLFVLANKFANGSQYQGVSQPINGVVCTNFKVSE